MKNNIDEFIDIINSRGFIYQSTGIELIKKQLKHITAYIGFDCTAPSLHVGSLIQIMLLRWLQKTGHKPIILIGGGTTKIGDPSGKDKSRMMLKDKEIYKNATGIKSVFSKFIKFEKCENKAELVNNEQWLNDINYIKFLRDYGKHFSINRMLSFESIKLRLERQQNLSFLEFNYMIIQAYDYLELNRKYGCNLQLGGSDQWGNIINGIELIRRVKSVNNSDENIHAITSPLITKSSGEKMGKSATGAIWLSEDMLSPYDYWQFWRNTEDTDVEKFLKLFTEIDLNEINKLSKLSGSEINEAKIILANHATEMAHGKEGKDKAEQIALNTFRNKSLDPSLPSLNLDRGILRQGIPAYKLFAYNKLLCSSFGESRRLIRQGGAKINDVKITDENIIIKDNILNSNSTAKMSAGAKRHIKLVIK